MSTEDKEKKVGRMQNEERSPYALLIDLEGAAIEARRAEYDALCNVLGATGKKLTTPLFARYCLHEGPAEYPPQLISDLGNRTNSPENFVEEIRSGIAMFCASEEARLNPILEGLISEAGSRNMDVVCLTGLKQASASGLLARWGAAASDIRVLPYDRVAKPFPRADTWLKAAKSISRTGQQCVAVVGGQPALRHALAAGFRTVVLPDEFTAFQDFSGADAVLDDPNDLQAAELLETLAPREPFI